MKIAAFDIGGTAPWPATALLETAGRSINDSDGDPDLTGNAVVAGGPSVV